MIISSQRPLPSQHTTDKTDRRPCRRRDSKPRSQQTAAELRLRPRGQQKRLRVPDLYICVPALEQGGRHANISFQTYIREIRRPKMSHVNLSKPTGYVMHQQFNIQQLYALPTLYLCVLYLSENKQRLVPLTA